MSLPTAAEQVEKLVNNKEPVDFIQNLLGARFLDGIFRNFETYSDEEQLDLLKVLPSQYLPTYPVVKSLLERNNISPFSELYNCPNYNFSIYCHLQELNAKK